MSLYSENETKVLVQIITYYKILVLYSDSGTACPFPVLLEGINIYVDDPPHMTSVFLKLQAGLGAVPKGIILTRFYHMEYPFSAYLCLI